MKLRNEIDGFLASKNFSQNTKSNYFYDLQGFHHFFENKMISDVSLELFRATLDGSKPSVQKRKISSINQYLYYQYQNGFLDRFYRLAPTNTPSKTTPKKVDLQIREFPEFYAPIQSLGQFIALLILEFGFTFAEIQNLKWENFNWAFRILTVEKKGIKRILPIREKFAIRVKGITNADELFSKSRQFLYLELKKYTPNTSKELREQYILRQRKSGKSIYETAENLGLSTIVTLERYYK
ncbi:site-specific tyrosine recombinase XerD [Lactococcus fujiensis]|nr:site-specific tyrosine recombinase XerD [Lactococcus fujiensis]